MKIELITWKDAESEGNDWMPREKAEESAKEKLPDAESVGFVLFENKESVSLVHSIDISNDMVAHAIKIPKAMITSRKVLKK